MEDEKLLLTVAVLNSLVVAVIASLWLGKGWGWLAVPGAFLVAFAPQAAVARRKREKKGSAPQIFRAGVGAVITGPGGKVLSLERRDVPGAWQLPQGGLESGEEPLEAVKREIREETGIGEGEIRPLSAGSRLLAYELPEEHRSRKTGRGQVHHWFLFSYEGPDNAITLGDRKEFRDWRWMSMDEMVSIVVPFKKPVYQELKKYLFCNLRDSK